MRHQAQHLPVRRGDAGNIFQGTVGVVGIFPAGGGQVLPAVRERDHLPAPDPVKGFLRAEEVPLPVGNRAIHLPNPACPEVVRCGFQGDKPAFQHSFPVGHQDDVTLILAGYLMIVLDIAIVITALPEMHTTLGFTDTGLSWVQNACLLTFGGLLLLGAPHEARQETDPQVCSRPGT
jgi:hypothetical protein